MQPETIPYELLFTEQDQELIDGVFSSLKNVENFNEFLRGCKALKVKQHFEAQTPMEQYYAKGAYFFITWMEKKLSQQKTATAKANKVPAPKRLGSRYAD